MGWKILPRLVVFFFLLQWWKLDKTGSTQPHDISHSPYITLNPQLSITPAQCQSKWKAARTNGSKQRAVIEFLTADKQSLPSTIGAVCRQCVGWNVLTWAQLDFGYSSLTFWGRNYYFFLILAHPVYKMWIIQEPNMLELWNKLHFEEKKNGEYITCLKYSVDIFVE